MDSNRAVEQILTVLFIIPLVYSALRFTFLAFLEWENVKLTAHCLFFPFYTTEDPMDIDKTPSKALSMCS